MHIHTQALAIGALALNLSACVVETSKPAGDTRHWSSDHSFQLCEPDAFCRRFMEMSDAELQMVASKASPDCSMLNQNAHSHCVSGGSSSGPGGVLGSEISAANCSDTTESCSGAEATWRNERDAALTTIALRQSAVNWTDEQLRQALTEPEPTCSDESISCRVEHERWRESNYRARTLLKARDTARAGKGGAGLSR